jgi:hypothetical protein
VPGPVNVKVVALIVAGFIAWLKIAVTVVLGHALAAPFVGVTELTVGAITPGLAPGLQHPGPKMSNRNSAANPTL